MKKDEKIIEEVRKRVKMGVDIPDYIKELYYKGLRKREAGMELINKAKFELQQTGNWDTRLKNSYNKKRQKANSEKMKAYQKEWRKNNLHYNRDWKRKNKK